MLHCRVRKGSCPSVETITAQSLTFPDAQQALFSFGCIVFGEK